MVRHLHVVGYPGLGFQFRVDLSQSLVLLYHHGDEVCVQVVYLLRLVPLKLAVAELHEDPSKELKLNGQVRLELQLRFGRALFGAQRNEVDQLLHGGRESASNAVGQG